MNYDNFSKAKEIDTEMEKLKCVKNSIIRNDFEEFIKRMIRKLERQFNKL